MHEVFDRFPAPIPPLQALAVQTLAPGEQAPLPSTAGCATLLWVFAGRLVCLVDGTALTQDELRVFPTGMLPRGILRNDSPDQPARYVAATIGANGDTRTAARPARLLTLTPGRLCELPIVEATASSRVGVTLYAARLAAGDDLAHALEPRHRAWVQALEGHVYICGAELVEGRGALLCDEPVLAAYAQTDSLLLLAELPVS